VRLSRSKAVDELGQNAPDLPGAGKVFQPVSEPVECHDNPTPHHNSLGPFGDDHAVDRFCTQLPIGHSRDAPGSENMGPSNRGSV
jgi:hypothetical protein